MNDVATEVEVAEYLVAVDGLHVPVSLGSDEHAVCGRGAEPPRAAKLLEGHALAVAGDGGAGGLLRLDLRREVRVGGARCARSEVNSGRAAHVHAVDGNRAVAGNADELFVIAGDNRPPRSGRVLGRGVGNVRDLDQRLVGASGGGLRLERSGRGVEELEVASGRERAVVGALDAHHDLGGGGGRSRRHDELDVADLGLGVDGHGGAERSRKTNGVLLGQDRVECVRVRPSRAAAAVQVGRDDRDGLARADLGGGDLVADDEVALLARAEVVGGARVAVGLVNVGNLHVAVRGRVGPLGKQVVRAVGLATPSVALVVHADRTRLRLVREAIVVRVPAQVEDAEVDKTCQNAHGQVRRRKGRNAW